MTFYGDQKVTRHQLAYEFGFLLKYFMWILSKPEIQCKGVGVGHRELLTEPRCT